MDRYEVVVKDAVVDALQEMAYHEANGEGLAYAAPWQLVGEADSLVAYKRLDPTNESLINARVFGRVRAEFGDIMGSFYAANSEDFFKTNQVMFEDVLDARVVSVRHTSTPAKPHGFFGIKYLCYQPVGSIPPRDQVYAEYIGYARDSKGRAVGFQATVPMDERDTPDLGHTMRVPRVRIKNICLVRALDKNAEQCVVFADGTYDLRESSSNVNAFLRKYLENMRDIAVIMDSKRMSTLDVVTKNDWVPDSLRKSCYVCTRTFNPTRHRHHCRMCGEVVCRKCLVQRNVSVGQSQGRGGIVKVKVCMFCVQKTRSNSKTTSEGSDSVSGALSPSNTITDSVLSGECRSYRSGADTEQTGEFDFDLGGLMLSPSTRNSEMSVATTIHERANPNGESFVNDLYMNSMERMKNQRGPLPPQPAQSRSARAQAPQQYGQMAHHAEYSPRSNHSSLSSGSSNSHQHHRPGMDYELASHHRAVEYQSRAGPPSARPPVHSQGNPVSQEFSGYTRSMTDMPQPSSRYLVQAGYARSLSGGQQPHVPAYQDRRDYARGGPNGAYMPTPVDNRGIQSINNQLAEQQELLRRMAIASNAPPQRYHQQQR